MKPEKMYSVNIVLAAGLIILSLILGSNRFQFETASQWLLYIGLAVLVITAASQKLGHYIADGWMKFGQLLGFINGKIILTFIFYVFLVPIATLKKITTKSVPKKSTNWTEVKEDAVDFKKPW